jgi:flagellar basal body-associated protein FliL
MGISKIWIWIIIGIVVISGSFGGYYLYKKQNAGYQPQCSATTLQIKSQLAEVAAQTDRLDTLSLDG